MEDLTVQSLIQKKNTKKLIWILLGIVGIYAVILTPLSIIVASNVLLAETVVLPFLIDLVMWVFNYLYYWVAFAFLLFASLFENKGGYRKIVAIYLGATILRYAANLIAGFFLIGFPTAQGFLRDYLPYSLNDILWDALQFSVAFLIVHLRRDKNTHPPRQLPITKLFSRVGSLAGTAMLLAVIPSVLQLVSRIIYDIDFGLPQNIADLFWMIFGYGSDFAGFLIGYFAMVLLLNHLYIFAEQTKQNYENEQNSVLASIEDHN